MILEQLLSFCKEGYNLKHYFDCVPAFPMPEIQINVEWNNEYHSYEWALLHHYKSIKEVYHGKTLCITSGK